MQDNGVEPDTVKLVGVLKACASVEALEEGKLIHEQIIKSGVESNIFVRILLIDMYIKCGCIDEAYEVFTKLPVHDMIIWSAMIMGFVKFGQGEKAVKLFQMMHQYACVRLTAFQEGKLIHADVIRRGLDSDTFVSSSLVDMYAKCGSIEYACRVLNNMLRRNVVSWSSMITGYAIHGLGKEAEELFEKICQENLDADAGLFVSLLSAFSHAGFLDKDTYCLESLNPVYGIQPTIEHYSCTVDLLGRSGCLSDAENIILKMPCKPDSSLWVSLLGSCRNHGNWQMGERAAEHVFSLDPGNVTGYILLSNVYATTGRADAVAMTNILQPTYLYKFSKVSRLSFSCMIGCTQVAKNRKVKSRQKRKS